MKGKFRKMLGVGLALALVLSFSLVAAVPAAAVEEPTVFSAVEFTQGVDGVAGWSTVEVKDDFGSYSVMLDAGSHPGYPEGVSDGLPLSWSRVEIYCAPIAISTFTNPTFDASGVRKINTADTQSWNKDWNKGPYLNILLDTNGDGLANDKLEGVIATSTDDEYGTSTGGEVIESWITMVGVNYYDADESLDTLISADTSAFINEVNTQSFATWKAALGTSVNVVGVSITLGNSNHTAPNQIVYVDDVTIGTTTYDLEPIFLDADWYNTSDTVGISVQDSNFNLDPVRADEMTVHAVSGTDTSGIDVTLEETDDNSSVFTGSFPTIGTSPGADELKVSDEDNITVTYYYLDGEGKPITGNPISDTATVDDSPPTIDDTLTVNDEPVTTPGTIIYNDEPTIVASVLDGGSGINEASIVMKVNGDAVTTIYSDGEHTVTYSTSPVLAAGTLVEVTVDVADNMGNAAETASWSFTIADDFNVSLNYTEIPAVGNTADVTATFTDVLDLGPGEGSSLLDTVKVSLSGVGVDLESGDFDGTDPATKGEAVSSTVSSLTFSVTPEQAGTITVTFVGTFDNPDVDPVATKTLDISVTGFAVEETWADVYLDTPPYDISMTITTEGGAKVNTGIVTITAPAAGGFEKDVNDDGELESFGTIVINGSTSQITYGGSDPEDFVVMNGYYEVTGITFAEVGDVGVLVGDVAGDDKAKFTTAFTVLGVDLYEVLLDPDTVTAGVATNVAVTVTEDGDPVTEIDSIKVADQTFDEGLLASDGVYEIALEPIPEAGTPAVTVTGEGGQKYGTADLTIGLPTVDYTIYETVGEGEEEEQVERNVMLTGVGNDYTVTVTVTDALGAPLDSGNVWLGTYDETATPPSFTALEAVATLPLTLEADGTGDIDVAQAAEDLLTAGSLVWKVGSGAADDAALILDLDQAITVEEPAYSLDYETPVIAGQSLTVSVLNNYEELQKYLGVILRNPDSTTDPFSTGNTGTFTFTPAVAGDYEVYSESVTAANFIDTIPVLAKALESIAALPEPVSLVVDGTQQLTVTATYSDASTLDVTAESTYESNDTSVATVSTGGLITAIVEGDATVTVSYLTETTTVLVTVSEEAVFDPMSYDEDEDGVISKTEAVVAVNDYFAEIRTKAEVVEVLNLYFAA